MNAQGPVPAVDLADLCTDDAARLDRAAHAIGQGFGELGLVTVHGHDVSPQSVASCYDAFQRTTDLPEATKRAYHRADIWHQRGWTPPNTEQAVVSGGQPDFKECWFAAPLALDEGARDLYPEIYADNVWPVEVPELAPTLTAVGTGLHEVGSWLLQGAERALRLDDGTFRAIMEGAAHVTRALRYLPLDAAQVDAGVLWGEEHTDFNLLTVLAGGRFLAPDGSGTPRPDDRAGLYLRTRPRAPGERGQLLQGVAPAGHLVSQVGQQLEILTGGLFQATPHVIKAPRRPGFGRLSIAHFLHVHPLAVLQPVGACGTPEAIRTFRPPVLAGTYAIKTLADIGLAPPDAIGRFGYRHYDRLAEIRASGEW